MTPERRTGVSCGRVLLQPLGVGPQGIGPRSDKRPLRWLPRPDILNEGDLHKIADFFVALSERPVEKRQRATLEIAVAAFVRRKDKACQIAKEDVRE